MAYYLPERKHPVAHVYDPTSADQSATLSCKTCCDKKLEREYESQEENFGHLRRPEDCDLFEHPYFSPTYMPLPVNYNTRLPHWSDSRVTKDWLTNWGNASIFNERAFGKWQQLFGTRYYYHDSRRL